MPNNISTNKSGFWAKKNERNGPPFTSSKDPKAGIQNPSLQDKDSNNLTDKSVMKATANAEMTKDGEWKGNDNWKGNVSC